VTGWRAIVRLPGLVLLCLVAASTVVGCGDGDESGAASAGGAAAREAVAAPAYARAKGASRPVGTADPAATFAPLVRYARDEQFRPVRGRWFVERSTLRWVPGAGCRRHPPIAAGTVVDELGLVDAPWMFTSQLGRAVGYVRRAPARRGGCDSSGRAFYANQLNRPHDTTPGRAPGLRRDQGFYLDLLDDRRGGERPAPDGLVATTGGESMFDRRPATVGGRPGLRLTYWMLYGMNEPAGSDGRAVVALTHEGDWERAEVLLQRGGAKRSWRPFAVRLRDADGSWRQIPWAAVSRVGEPGGRPTHPELFAARGSHTLYAEPGRYDRSGPGDATVVDAAATACAGCPRWEMWLGQVPVDSDTWFGFGGAWGEVGAASATTGPLGPHGPVWPAGNPRAQLAWRNQHFGNNSSQQ